MCTYTRWHYSTLTGLFSLVLVHTNSQDAHYMVSFAEVFNNTDVLLLLTDNLQPDDLLHLRTVNRSCRRLITLDEVRRIRDTEYPQARCRVVVEITEYRSTEVVEAQGGEFVAKLKVTIGTDRSSCCKMANIILPARCRSTNGEEGGRAGCGGQDNSKCLFWKRHTRSGSAETVQYLCENHWDR